MNYQIFAATYNCNDSANAAYGAGDYSTCNASGVGAPNTGFFSPATIADNWMILLPLAIGIIMVVTSLFLKRKKPKNSL